MLEFRLFQLAAALALLTAAPAGAAPTSKAKVAGPSLESCLAEGERCWGRVRLAFGKILKAHMLEVEGALPDRFFPKTVTFSKGGLDSEGHFLDVQCVRSSGGRAPCPTERDALEDRVLKAVLLKSFPGGPEPRFDEESWVPTAEGKRVLRRIQERFTDLDLRLARLKSDNLPKKKLSDLPMPAGPQDTPEPQPPAEVPVTDKPVQLLR